MDIMNAQEMQNQFDELEGYCELSEFQLFFQETTTSLRVPMVHLHIDYDEGTATFYNRMEHGMKIEEKDYRYLLHWSDMPSGFSVLNEVQLLVRLEAQVEESELDRKVIEKILSAPIDTKIDVECGYLESVTKVQYNR